MYAQIDQFSIDKAVNTIVEEGIAPVYIRAYYALQGQRVQRVQKYLADREASKAYDLVDTFGIKWEVKYDRLWHITGNVYIELQSLEASQADKYLIFAGKGFVIAKSRLWEAITPLLGQAKSGGDNMRSMGVCLPLQVLEQHSESVIIM